jgi:hypothetical protein
VIFFVIDREASSLGLATSLDSLNERLETHQRVIGAPLKSRDASEKDAQTISHSEGNFGTELILESLIFRNH